MALTLVDDVHAVALGEDLVWLDVAADTYFCWVGAAAAVVVGADRRISADNPLAASALLEAGLVVERDDQGPPCAPAPSLPQVGASLEVDFSRPAPRLADGLAVAMVGYQTASDFKRRTFAQLIAWSARRAPGERRRFSPPTPQLLDVAVQYHRLRVWAPFDGPCLMRSYMMLRYLRCQHLDAAWVIGVRTWPFAAHCWLQVGDLVLDDDLERLAAFTPILVV